MQGCRCSICGRKFTRGLQLDSVRYFDAQTFFKKRWVIKKRQEQIYICEKCSNVIVALVRNNLAIGTSDIMNE